MPRRKRAVQPAILTPEQIDAGHTAVIKAHEALAGQYDQQADAAYAEIQRLDALLGKLRMLRDTHAYKAAQLRKVL